MLVTVKHSSVAIAYCLAGGFLIFVGMAKLGHAAYIQAFMCLTVGVCLAFVAMKQARHP